MIYILVIINYCLFLTYCVLVENKCISFHVIRTMSLVDGLCVFIHMGGVFVYDLLKYKNIS